MMLMGMVLGPVTAHARGRRAVPNLREPRQPMGPAARRLSVIGVTVHVASEEGLPIATRRQVEQWVTRANRALNPHGIAVEVRSITNMAGHTSVTRRRERRQLAAMAEYDGTIHVFVTESLDAPSLLQRRRVRGLHWRYLGLNRELRQREYVMVTLGAPKTTFAHEVGHLLGLRHDLGKDNIMCSCRRGTDTRFTAAQGASMRQGVSRFASRQQQAERRALAQRRRWADRTRRR